MKLTSTIILCLFNFALFAQNMVEGTVIDSETKNPIPYVNIGIVKKNIGTVSDLEGKFDFKFPSTLENDTIKLSSIGYKSKSMLAKDFLSNLKTNSIIELLPDITKLNEVVVISKKLKEKNLGTRTKSRMFGNGFSNAPLGCEFGSKIKIKDSPTYIKKFHVNINSNTSEKMKFRLNFYNIKNGLPNEKIVAENIIFSIGVKQGKFTLNLEQYNIIVEEDFYCTIELVENQKPDEEIFFSAKFLGKTTAYRRTSQAEWQKNGKIGVGFNYTVQY